MANIKIDDNKEFQGRYLPFLKADCFVHVCYVYKMIRGDAELMGFGDLDIAIPSDKPLVPERIKNIREEIKQIIKKNCPNATLQDICILSWQRYDKDE